MKTSNAGLRFSDESLQKLEIKLPSISVFKRILQAFVPFFYSGNEPQVWSKTNRYGNTSWYAYDPVSGYSVSRDSEAEMREWLEQRYYN
jgi:hypothetical protein